VSEQEAELAPEPVSTGRLETFSDGVFAIAATLLVLDLAARPRMPAAGTCSMRCSPVPSSPSTPPTS